MNKELEGLQNHVNSCYEPLLSVHEYVNHDRRKTIKHYFLTVNGTTISPILNYESMNHFLLGFNKALKLNIH